MRSLLKLRFAFLLALLAGDLAHAEITLPKILASHMVVQRDLPVHVWGMALPGEEVSVSFRGESRTAKANRLGRWSVYLAPGPAGGPFQMTVRGPAAQAILLEDVLVGDVWVASGQSNMEFEMHKAATAVQDLPHADIPRIRLLMVKKDAAEYAEDDIETDGWAASTPETAKDFSAVAWYFAREIEQREHVPVGVIDSTWGGTLGESWTRLTALGEDAALSPLFVSRGKMTDHEVDSQLEDKDRKLQFDAAKAQGKPLPRFPWHPPLEIWGPGLLWNGMIAPLTP
jgi:sialate O-acetylesterase